MAFDVSKVSPLGFGCMRWEGRETNQIRREYLDELIDTYMEAGGNYFDTAWAYPNSEAALRESLVKRYPRESFILATKCVTWTHCESEADLEKQLQESLAGLGVDYVDVYLMHNLGGFRTASFEKFHCWEFVKSVKERGLAKHIGFSAHCTPAELEGFIAAYPEAELVQLQVNYADWDNPNFCERECVEVARRHGLPVVAMEPVRGGLLANPSQAVRDILDAELPEDSYATAALRFAASVPGVFTTLSGMSTVEQVRDNCGRFQEFEPFDAREQAAMERVQAALRGDATIPCTGCDYCAKVCPQNVGISGSMTALNYYINGASAAEANYQLGFVVSFNQAKAQPSACIRCGACEAACPQGIPIMACFDRIDAEILSVEPDMPVTMKP